MANVITGRVWTGDTVGILSKIPVVIKAFGVIPSAAAGTVTLKYWDEGNYNTGSHISITASASSGTVTDDNAANDLLTAAAFPAGDVVEVVKTSGLAANKTYHLIGTAGDNDAIIITPTATWADEANVAYALKCYPARLAFISLTQATTAKDGHYYFGDKGIWFPNLILSALTNAKIYVYLA